MGALIIGGNTSGIITLSTPVVAGPNVIGGLTNGTF